MVPPREISVRPLSKRQAELEALRPERERLESLARHTWKKHANGRDFETYMQTIAPDLY